MRIAQGFRAYQRQLTPLGFDHAVMLPMTQMGGHDTRRHARDFAQFLRCKLLRNLHTFAGVLAVGMGEFEQGIRQTRADMGIERFFDEVAGVSQS